MATRASKLERLEPRHVLTHMLAFADPDTLLTADEGYELVAHELVDLNDDSLSDLVAVQSNGSTSRVTVLVQDLEAQFQLSAEVEVPLLARDLLVANVNNDSIPDIGLFTESGNLHTSLLRQDSGDLSFEEFIQFVNPLESTNPFFTKYQIADLNGDGFGDVMHSSDTPTGDRVLNVFLSDAAGRFDAPVSYESRVAKVSDLNNDSFPDLVVTFSEQIQVLLNDGSGAFESTDIARLTGGSIFEPVDIDGDGITDIVTAFGGVHVRYGAGDGTFSEPIVLIGGSGVISTLHVVDINSDDILDVYVGPEIVPHGRNVPARILLNVDDGFEVIQFPGSTIEGTPMNLGADRVGFELSSRQSIRFAPQIAPQWLSPSFEPFPSIAQVVVDAGPDAPIVLLANENKVTELVFDPDADEFAATEIDLERSIKEVHAFVQLRQQDEPPTAVLVAQSADDPASELLVELRHDGESWTTATRELDGQLVACVLTEPGCSAFVEDLDRDGLDDLVLALQSETGSSLRTFMNTGLALDSAKVQPLAMVNRFDRISKSPLRFADMNSEGRIDFVQFGNGGQSGIIQVSVLNEDGTWTNWDPLFRSPFVDLLDVNGDGAADIADQRGALTLSQGNGTWTSPDLPGAVWSRIAEDFDADGKVEYAYADNSTGNGTVWLVEYDSAIDQWENSLLQEGGSFPVQMWNGDFDGDGDQDLLWQEVLFGEAVATFTHLNDGSGQFERQDSNASIGTAVFAVVDLDGDGSAELVANSLTKTEVHNFVDGGWQTVSSISDPWGPFEVEDTNQVAFDVGDVTGDGLPDLVHAFGYTTDPLRRYAIYAGLGDLRFAPPERSVGGLSGEVGLTVSDRSLMHVTRTDELVDTEVLVFERVDVSSFVDLDENGEQDFLGLSDGGVTLVLRQLPGDFDDDRNIDISDLDILLANVGSRTDMSEQFDLNHDLRIDQHDVDYWIANAVRTRRGDTNLDGRVDFGDFLELAANFGHTEARWSQGDFNGDGVVDFADFLLMAANFGFERAS